MNSFSTLFFSIVLLFSFGSTQWINAQENEHADSLYTYLALGDSYTIGESVAREYQWPRQLRDSLRSMGMAVDEPLIIAKTGWRTDEMLTAAKIRVDNQEFDLVSLLIGVNNEYQGKSSESFKAEFEQCLQYAIERCKDGEKGVFVLSIPDYGFTPFGSEKQEQITNRLREYNKVCRQVCKKYGVLFINITDISQRVPKDSTLVAPDGLHPSGKQYALWVRRSAQKVYKLIQN